MSLISCPQEGCGRRISPTASICPGCGFNTQQYFREDLRGFQNHDSMLKFAHWVDNGDGTITDTKNSLTWIRAPYGIKWHGEFFAGEAVMLDWDETTSRFGIGNIAGINDAAGYIDQEQLRREGVVANGYTRGADYFTFAGSTGWRLPTICEYLTLKGLEEIATDFVKGYYYRYFDVVFFRGSRFLMDYTRTLGMRYHSATYIRRRKQILGKTLLNGMAWAYDAYHNHGIDVGSEEKWPFFLVKS